MGVAGWEGALLTLSSLLVTSGKVAGKGEREGRDGDTLLSTGLRAVFRHKPDLETKLVLTCQRPLKVMRGSAMSLSCWLWGPHE